MKTPEPMTYLMISLLGEKSSIGQTCWFAFLIADDLDLEVN